MITNIFFCLFMIIVTVIVAKSMNRYDRLHPNRPIGYARSQSDCQEGWEYNKWTNSCINKKYITNG